MALEYRGTAYDGTPIYFDPEKAEEQARNMSEREMLIATAKSGCFDCWVRLPMPPESKSYEALDDPGYIAAIRSAEYRGYYHPLDMNDDSLPKLDVVLDENGYIVDPKTIKKRD